MYLYICILVPSVLGAEAFSPSLFSLSDSRTGKHSDLVTLRPTTVLSRQDNRSPREMFKQSQRPGPPPGDHNPIFGGSFVTAGKCGPTVGDSSSFRNVIVAELSWVEVSSDRNVAVGLLLGIKCTGTRAYPKLNDHRKLHFDKFLNKIVKKQTRQNDCL